jgi:hypothetical protein
MDATLRLHTTVHLLVYLLCNDVPRGPSDPFFDDIMPTTRGLGFQGGTTMDGTAKIERDERERRNVRFTACIRLMLVVIHSHTFCKLPSPPLQSYQRAS